MSLIRRCTLRFHRCLKCLPHLILKSFTSPLTRLSIAGVDPAATRTKSGLAPKSADEAAMAKKRKDVERERKRKEKRGRLSKGLGKGEEGSVTTFDSSISKGTGAACVCFFLGFHSHGVNRSFPTTNTNTYVACHVNLNKHSRIESLSVNPRIPRRSLPFFSRPSRWYIRETRN